MKKILVAIDESEVSEQVLQEARILAEKLNSDVLVMTVIPRVVEAFNYRFGSDFGRPHLDGKVSESMAEKMLEYAGEVFREFKGKFDTLSVSGDPAEEILLVADQEQPDLLIMGNRGLSGFTRIMLGSVSTKVLHHATCDVMIVKHE
ncbi:MAG: universal stress protein [Bacillota bacterium]|nr:universal stress protein [Bacillota bacterium]MDW7677045.1 universal stress protein [Bacillota bacterium]